MFVGLDVVETTTKMQKTKKLEKVHDKLELM